MRPTLIQQQAVAARLAMIVGAETYDRLFLGFELGEIDSHNLLFAFVNDEANAAEIEERFALHISIVATDILGQAVEFVNVLPKELSTFRDAEQ